MGVILGVGSESLELREASREANLTLHYFGSPSETPVYWIGVVLATIGASLILGALTYVSTLIGVLVNAMIVLMCGPIIDRVLQRRGRASSR
jgi:hypothetical protein